MAQKDPTRTKTIRIDYARKLARMPRRVRRRIYEQLKLVSQPDQDFIEEIKQFVDEDITQQKAKPHVRNFQAQLFDAGLEDATQNLKNIGITIEVSGTRVSTELIDSLENMTLDLVKGLNEDTRKDLAFQLRQGILNGEANYKLKDRVRKVMSVKEYRARNIARTESIRVYNQAAKERYQNADVKKFKWIAASDERTCVQCMALDGKVFKFGEHVLPPLHPMCRCSIAPVVEEQ